MPLLTANSTWGCAVETVYGTAASVSTYTPIGSPKVTPDVTWLDDSDFRGSPAMHYDQVPGVRKDMFSGKTYIYTDVYPNLIRGILGSVDTTASVGPSLYTHTIGLLNSPNTGSQAPSYTILNNSVDAIYQITASRMVDLSIAFAADAAVETTFSYTGNISSTVASVAVNESTQHLVPSWSCSASIGGASVAVVESAQLDIKRNTAPIFTIGQQGPYNNFQGPIDVSGKFVFVVEQGGSYYANSLIRNQQSVVLRFTDPATNYYVQFQMSNVQLESPVIDQSKNYISLQANFVAVANTTDQVSGGYSPIKAVISNNISTAY